MIDYNTLDQAIEHEATIYYYIDNHILEIRLTHSDYISDDRLITNKGYDKYGHEFLLEYLHATKEGCIRNKYLSTPILRCIRAPSFNDLQLKIKGKELYNICTYTKEIDDILYVYRVVYFNGGEYPQLFVQFKEVDDHGYDIVYDKPFTPENYVKVLDGIYKDLIITKQFNWSEL